MQTQIITSIKEWAENQNTTKTEIARHFGIGRTYLSDMIASKNGQEYYTNGTDIFLKKQRKKPVDTVAHKRHNTPTPNKTTEKAGGEKKSGNSNENESKNLLDSLPPALTRLLRPRSN